MLKFSLTSEKTKQRLEQANEMDQIWNDNSELVRMYLKGCIATANALAGKCFPEDKKIS